MPTKDGRQFVQRSPEAIREAAAKLCEREAKYLNDPEILTEVAQRIRRIPLAGLYKRTK